MEKTVQVVDEAGNRYEATYPKRAKGLVKNGRARFIDDETICLACPPNKRNINSEDMKIMNTENEKNIISAEENTAEQSMPTAKYSLEYALGQIERIANETSHIHEALMTIGSIKNAATVSKGGSADEMAKATAEVVRCRETTNQQLIAFYEKMIDDLKPKKEIVETEHDKIMAWVKDFVASMKSGVEIPDYGKL